MRETEIVKPTEKLKGITLLNDRVLVLPDESENMTAGGILLPDNAREKPRFGRVIAVGPGRQCEAVPGGRHPMTIKVGDRVMYQVSAGEFSVGAPVMMDGYDKPLRIFEEREAIGVVEE